MTPETAMRTGRSSILSPFHDVTMPWLRHRDYEPRGFWLGRTAPRSARGEKYHRERKSGYKEDANSMYEDVKEVLGLDRCRAFLYGPWLQDPEGREFLYG